MSDDGERLPVFYRTIKMDAALWQSVKSAAKTTGKPIRQVVDEALEEEMPRIIASLNAIGMTGGTSRAKLVRLPVDDNVIGRMNCGRRATGIAAFQLLASCLQLRCRSNHPHRSVSNVD